MNGNYLGKTVCCHVHSLLCCALHYLRTSFNAPEWKLEKKTF